MPSVGGNTHYDPGDGTPGALRVVNRDGTALGGAVSTGANVALASAATSAQLLAANTARRGLLLNNTDANAVHLYYGTTATTAKFTVRIPSNGYWEMPLPIYTGRIDVIWAADGSGSLIGSEL